MENDTFWISIWKLVLVGFIAFVAMVGGCTVNKQRVMADMVKNGVDPLKAQCAVYMGDTDNKSVCAILATQATKQ